jgi:hypothetical protein
VTTLVAHLKEILIKEAYLLSTAACDHFGNDSPEGTAASYYDPLVNRDTLMLATRVKPLSGDVIAPAPRQCDIGR